MSFTLMLIRNLRIVVFQTSNNHPLWDINISNMKKYIGTKVIMAEPMTMTEAQKVLGREIKPATVEEDGYLVEYKDGYKSWSPKSVFDEAYAAY